MKYIKLQYTNENITKTKTNKQYQRKPRNHDIARDTA